MKKCSYNHCILVVKYVFLTQKFSNLFLHPEYWHEQNSTAPENDGNNSSTKEQSSDEEEDDLNENVFNLKTFLSSEDPKSEVFVNTRTETVKKRKRGKNEKVHVIAPGERKIPSEWLRQNDFDVAAFPWLFSNGKYGLFYDKMDYHPSESDSESDSEGIDEKFIRSKSLTPSKYFASKILNKNTQFAKDPDFVFVAQQYIERFDLERKIEIATRKGKLNAKNEVTNEGNHFDMFKDIPGRVCRIETV